MRELFREFAAARDRATDDYRRDLTLAWHINWVWFKTKSDRRGHMPELASLLRQVGDGASKKQTATQMKAALGIISGQYDIPLRKRAKRTVH